MSDTIRRTGSCLCGGVHFVVTGRPVRVGLCHCKDCRKAGGSVYSAFGIWPRDAFEASGEVATYGTRSFCPTCGGRVSFVGDDEVEVMLGSLDVAPTDLAPEYELWITRREAWLHALPGTQQFEHDRPGDREMPRDVDSPAPDLCRTLSRTIENSFFGPRNPPLSATLSGGPPAHRSPEQADR